MRYCTFGVVLFAALFSSHAQAFAAGDQAPHFSLPNEQGQPLALASLRGQFVYLDFWASWCGPCRQSFPWMNQLSQRTEKAALKVIAINVDERKEDAAAFLEKFPANFKVLYDPKGEVASRYELPGMPTSFLIAPDGRVIWMHIGFRPGDAAVIQTMILQEMRKKQ